MQLWPLARWDRCENDLANAALVEWGHWLGACDRPFAVQSFGLWLSAELVAVAVSASTVGATCERYRRQEVVELARLCARPDHRDMTRVALRLWRATAAVEWDCWPVRAYVSYANAVRHSGDLYRFDGWVKLREVKGSTGGGTWTAKKQAEPKVVWAWPLDERERDALRREKGGRLDVVRGAGA